MCSSSAALALDAQHLHGQAICQRLGIADDELLDAMAFCFDRMKLVTEPSGVCGIAALLLLRPDRGGLIGRGRGVLLLMLYAGFVWLTLTS